MRNEELVRRVLFFGGVAATVVSLGLVVGSFLEPVNARGSMREAVEIRPWVHWGLGLALAGLGLSYFGRGRWRMVCLVAAVILMAWWYGAGTVLGG